MFDGDETLDSSSKTIYYLPSNEKKGFLIDIQVLYVICIQCLPKDHSGTTGPSECSDVLLWPWVTKSSRQKCHFHGG